MRSMLRFPALVALALGWTLTDFAARTSPAAEFGINFGAGIGRGNGGWGPYFLDPAHGTSARGYQGHASAFGVPAANWYEPGSVANTSQLPGSPTSVPFSAPDMGGNAVNIHYQSMQGWTGQPAYPYPAFGFANANQYATVDNDMDGNPDILTTGRVGEYVQGPLLPTNGQPISGEYAVLAGFIFATAEGEYNSIQNPWAATDIVVTISGLSNIASGYTVKLLASAGNGNPHVLNGTKGFTPATVTDGGATSETINFAVMEDDRPNYWSMAESFEVDADENTHNPFVSVAGMGTGTTTFTGDTLTITLSGANEYYNDEGDFTRTTLAGVIIEYDSTVPPGPAGDFDGDGDVDGADFVAWQTNFPKTTGALQSQGDADGDGDVDGADFGLWQSGFPAPSSPGTSPVPEPSSLVLGGLIVVGLAIARRQRNS